MPAKQRPRRIKAGSVVRSAPPPENFDALTPAIARVEPDTKLYRIHDPQKYNTRALTFRRQGPHSRFDHHTPDALKRAVLYLGITPTCCVGEVFGNSNIITLAGNKITIVITTRQLALLDLRGIAARKAGTIPAISQEGDRAITQAWSRWWYEHPALDEIDGLIYRSANTDESSICLWERAKGKLTKAQEFDLTDPTIRNDLELIADKLDMIIDTNAF